MALPAGTRLGPYQIVSAIGAGGMGEVYRARDPRLGRDVAIKVLGERVADDPAHLKRFEHEARAASALNHPNIVAVFDVGASDSGTYLAMELIDGITLRDLLLRDGGLPTRKLLDVATQIADGLAAAHGAGIVHRDLKPGNVMISRDGFVKILDFGIAKVDAGSRNFDSNPDAPTVPEPQTAPGVVMGTREYMSPEQARGKPIDYRSDQFSFGTVLYEMVTGKAAFARENTADTLMAILQDDPPGIAQRNLPVPPPLRWIIERCLAKDPEDRFASTSDLRRDLARLREGLSELSGGAPAASGEIPPTRSGSRNSLIWILAGALAVAAVVIAGLWRRSDSPPRAMRFSLSPPENTAFNFYSSSPAPAALSRDGRQVTFAVRDASGKTLLWVRPLDAVAARPLEGTDGATYPFWSPDGRFIGYFANGRLRKVAVAGGSPETICDAPDGRGGSWSPDGTVAFAPQGRGPIYRVSAGGGVPLAATRLSGSARDVSHRWPAFLPDGRRFLYLQRDSVSPKNPTNGVWLASLDGSPARQLLHDVTNALFAAGHLLFVREGALMAIPFDLRRSRITGPAATVVDQVQFHPYRWQGVFSASETGALLFQPGKFQQPGRLERLDRTGNKLAELSGPRELAGLRMSPDGRSCAVEVEDFQAETIDIWIADLSRSLMVPLTHGEGISDSPAWSPDGSRLAFASNRSGRWKLYLTGPQGGAETVILDDANGVSPTDWSPDGRVLLLNARNESTGGKWEVRTLSMDKRETTRFLKGGFSQKEARFSPDGAFVAYTSDESGTSEIYLRRLGEPGGKVRVSSGGGSLPVWRRDGKELLYLGPDRRIMAASVRLQGDPEIGTITPLFPIRTRSSATDSSLYDVSPDGKAFLVNSALEGEASSMPLTFVLNWTADLKH